MGEGYPDFMGLPMWVIIMLVSIIVLTILFAGAFYSGFGKDLWNMLANMLLGATGYTGIFSGIAKGVISAIGSMLPF